MAADTRILRGDQSAQQLRERLGSQAGVISAWMDRETRILKSDDNSRVGLLQLQGELYCLKFYRSKSALQGVAFRCGMGRGIRSYDMARKLRSAGLAVPAPRGCLLVPGGMLLLTEGLPASIDLKSRWLQQPSAEELRQIMQQAGETLAGLHQAGFSHGDCKWSNLQICADRIYLLDLDNVRHSRPGSAGCTRDLARFTLNAEDMGLAAADYESFLGSYGAVLGQRPDALRAAILVPLQRLRNRHLSKYGERGHRLI